MQSQVMATSCDGLVEICLKYNTIQSPTRFINLEILDNASEDHVFLGEVTFLNGDNEPSSIHYLQVNTLAHIVCILVTCTYTY